MIEDLQWVDPSSSELLFHLSQQISTIPILFIGSYRPEEISQGRENESHPLKGLSAFLDRELTDFQVIDLNKDKQNEGRKFVQEYLDKRLNPNRLKDSFRERLLQYTEGHPLFTDAALAELIEEKNLKKFDDVWDENPERPVDWDSLAERILLHRKIEKLIKRRIGLLNKELIEMLQMACTEGVSFTVEVIAKALDKEPAEIARILSDSLSRKHGLIAPDKSEQVGNQRLHYYKFLHYLSWKVVYDDMDDAEKDYKHSAVASALEELYKGRVEEKAHELAEHFQRFGKIKEAIEYLELAGTRAMGQSANKSAILHFEKGIQLFDDGWNDLLLTYQNGDLNENEAEEKLLKKNARFWVDLAVAQLALKGHAASEVGNTYLQAQKLLEKVKDTSLLFRVRTGLALHYTVRSEHKMAEKLGKKLLEQAPDEQDAIGHGEAHFGLATTFFHQGKLKVAQEHFEMTRGLYNLDEHHSYIRRFGHDSGLEALAYLALTYWMLGDLKQADNFAKIAMESTVSDRIYRYCEIFCLSMIAVINYLKRDRQATEEQTERIISLSNETGAIQWIAHAEILQAWSLFQQEQTEEHISQMEKALTGWLNTEANLAKPFYLLPIIESYKEIGQPEKALDLTQEALKFIEDTNERWAEPGLYLLKGELVLSIDKEEVSEAAELFKDATAIAETQEAKFWELRAWVYLGQLYFEQGSTDQKEEVLQGLKKICGHFSGEFETQDLREAKLLLKTIRPLS